MGKLASFFGGQSTKSLREQCLEWLENEGYKYEERSERSISFKSEGMTVGIYLDPEDPQYLTISLGIEMDEPRERLLHVANEINNKAKMLKAGIDEDDDIMFTIEVLLPEGSSVNKVMERYLSMLHGARYRMRTLLSDNE